MSTEEMDKALHEVMTVIWKAYRTDCKTFNQSIRGLHEKYGEIDEIYNFIVGMGMGLAPAVNRKAKEARDGAAGTCKM